MNDTTLRITEIFLSLQGESSTIGWPTVFVRLTGCPLRCVYCDTAYAFSGGHKQSLSEIVQQVKSYGVNHVTVTGGEPLAQPNCLPLLTHLCDQSLQVSLETSGAIDIVDIDQRVMIVMDLKTPASQECHRNVYQNLQYLKQTDQVKFVICNRDDYDWAKSQLVQYNLTTHCQVLLSPSYGQVNPAELAQWIVEDRLSVRFQMQLHKILWGDQPGK